MNQKRIASMNNTPFGKLLGGLAKVPKSELLAEERKYEAAKRRRQAKAAKKKS
jgi:hypothetical protein